MTGRTFYALKQTRTVAVIGVFEALAYVVYTPLLGHWLGAGGLALAYVVYFNASLVWQVLLLRHRTGRTGGSGIAIAFARTGAAALVGGAAAWAITLVAGNPFVQLLGGGVVGLGAYLAGLVGLRSADLRLLQSWRDVRPATVGE